MPQIPCTLTSVPGSCLPSMPVACAPLTSAPAHTLRFVSDRWIAASTLAGVGRLLNMLGTYLVNICSGGLPPAAHCCWKSPRMPVDQLTGAGQGRTQE